MELKDINESVERAHAAMVEALAKRDEEIKSLGGASAKTAETVDKVGKELIELKSDQLKKHEEFLVELKNSTVRMDEIEKKLGRAAAFGDRAIERGAPGVAHTFVNDERFKAFAAQKGQARNSDRVAVKSLFPFMAPQAVKATFGLTSVDGDLVVPQRIETVSPQLRQLRIRDLLPVRQMSSDSITYLEETAFSTEAVTGSVTSITRSSSTATVTTAAAHNLQDGDMVRIAGAVETEYNVDARVTVTGATTFTYTVAGTPSTPATGTITWKHLNAGGAAAVVAEGGLKPEALIEFIERTANATVIANWIKITRQAAADAPQVIAYIEDRLLRSVAEAEERQILYGAGTGANLQGIMTHPNVQTYAWSAGETNDNKVDAIRRAMTLAHVREFIPTGGVLNPLDKEDIDLLKGDDLHYIWTQAPGADGGDRIWRIPFVVTNSIEEGDFLVGAFGSGGASLWDREDASIQMATQNEDDFVRNLITLLAEERLAFLITRPDAFVAGTFDSAPA